MLAFLIFVLVALPIAWLVSEVWGNHPVLRVALGILTIVVISASVYVVNSLLTTINYNNYYGSATQDLIRTSIAEIEDGHVDRVLKVLRAVDIQYHPTYENRAGYGELVEKATVRMKGDTPILPGSQWDASEFSKKTWVGHWENDSGFWLVIDDLGTSLGIVRSGEPISKIHSVSLSKDAQVLTFKEGDEWVHTITLKNKHEASHEWFDAKKQSVWKLDALHKLVRK